MAEIREIEDGEVVTPEVEEEKKPIGEKMDGLSSAPLDANLTAVAQVMGLDEQEKSKYKREIKTLITWAKTQTKERDPINLKWTLRNLQMKLGSPPLSEKMITRAARFAYLDMEGKSIDKEKLSLME